MPSKFIPMKNTPKPAAPTKLPVSAPVVPSAALFDGQIADLEQKLAEANAAAARARDLAAQFTGALSIVRAQRKLFFGEPTPAAAPQPNAATPAAS